MNLLVGKVVSIWAGGQGRSATVSVRGVLAEIALDLVPRAQVGDSVLIHAGVALACMEPTDERQTWSKEGRSCV